VPKQEDIDMFIETTQIFHWRRVFHKGRDFSYCKQLIAGVMMFTASAAVVVAAPEGGVVVGGVATITQSTDRSLTEITQDPNHPRVDINWDSFNTKGGATPEVVQFIQKPTRNHA
jgi:hypothetical protein